MNRSSETSRPDETVDLNIQATPSFGEGTARLEDQHPQSWMHSPLLPMIETSNISPTPARGLLNGEAAAHRSSRGEYPSYNRETSKRIRPGSVVEPDLHAKKAGGQRESDFLTGSPKGMSLGRGRLRSGPSNKRLCRMVCTVGIHDKYLDHLLKQPQTSDLLGTGECTSRRSGLSFRSVSEAMEVDRKLRTAVESWQRKECLQTDVEYTLLSHVKGKGRA